ncbi:YlxR family protein [Schaalia hyovaginalis]|nr:YlxR family protein [Schaalia hyovaginalis]MCI7671167.1 YlxR family protein [Schaalia hyovaginalis]MDY5506737.1 YlxR family protein [Schaalia hyovaginalis]
MGADPVRTCVGCAKRSSRSDLIRIAASHGIMTLDPEAVRPGRGAWIHPDPRCVDRARRTRALRRALRLQEDPPEDLWDALEKVVKSRASSTPDNE